jgi:GxxExxY protein
MLLDDPETNKLTASILGAAIEVHRTLGPGLLESIYRTCLQYEFASKRLKFSGEHTVPIKYKGTPVPGHYRFDLLVEDRVVVEVKAVDGLLNVHQAQVLTYLKVTGYPTGLLINFNVAKLMDGVRRLVNPSPTR